MKTLIAIFITLCVGLICSSAYADNTDIGSPENPVEFSDWNPQQFEHEDADPWKGWAFVYVKNTSDVEWGDFHFEIYSYDQSDISNVDFIVTSPFEPTSTQTPLTWSVNNEVVGATLDLYFYTDPVGPGEVATFQVYTDNTTSMVNFGLMIHPTPVPEPATIMLLSLGALAVFRKRRA